MIGKSFSHYKIVEKLGEGGMGVVYKAHDTRLNRLVALKFLPLDQFPTPADRERLLAEARAAAAVTHPNICSVYGIEEFQDDEFLVMEYVEGRSLRSLLGGGRLAPAQAVRIARQVAMGLEAAHARGVIHRDIKPENILLAPGDVAKIADFGLARTAEHAAGGAPESVAGTIAYMSPEQVQGAAVGAATDIWSLGVVLHEMTAGELPFAGEYAQALMYAILHEKPRPASASGADVPAPLQKIIDRCLEKIPAVRFESAGALAEELKCYESEIRNPRASAVRSIAVLPFEDISPDRDNQYFSDGLTEEITANLSKLRTLRVLSRTSVMLYDRTKKTTSEIAADLGVQYLLEGSIRKHGTDLRITTRLIDASKDSYQWSESFRGTMDDIFDIQETVAGKIVKALKLRLTPGEKRTLKRRATKNTDAYQLYLKGRFFWNKRNKEGLLTALKFFQEAIDTDPLYPQAWAGLADAYNLLSEHPGVSRRENYPKAKAAVARALELEPNLPEAKTSHASLTMLYEWDWATAEKEFRLAIYLNPKYATAHHWFAEWLLFMGRMDEAIRENEIAVELDPISPAILKDLGMKYYYARKYDEAIAYAKKTIELDSAFVMANRLLALAYQAKGMAAEAVEENRRWAAVTGNAVEGNLWIAHVYASCGRHEEARALLAEALAGPPLQANLYRAVTVICAELGDIDEAFAWLEKGVELRSESLCSLKIDPKMDKLRTDPRYADLLRRIGLAG